MMISPRVGSTSLECAQLYCQAHPELTIGVTSGSFDLMHDFHLRYLKQCRRQCDILVVGVDSNRHVQERKGLDRPILSEHQRLMLVNALKYVEFSYIQDDPEDFRIVVESLKAHKVFRNQDFRGREHEVAVGDSGAQVVIIPDVTELDSTSSLIAKIKAGSR